MKKFLYVTLAVLAAVVVFIGVSSMSKATACPPGQCEPIMKWVYVDKINQPIDQYSCPVGYIDNGASGCKKKVDDYGWKCDSSWTLFNTDHCKKYYSNSWHYKDAEWGVTGWHWDYKDKVNSPVDHWVCPPGSQTDGSKCKMKVQDGWNCNCSEGTHPDGEGHCVDNPPPPEMCTVPGLENLEATDPNCQEPPEMCTVAGLEGLTADDPDCQEPPVMCTVPGLENLEATDPNCQTEVVETPAPPSTPVFYDVCVDGVTKSVNQNDLESYMDYPRGECAVIPVTGGGSPSFLTMLWQSFLSLFQ